MYCLLPFEQPQLESGIVSRSLGGILKQPSVVFICTATETFVTCMIRHWSHNLYSARLLLTQLPAPYSAMHHSMYTADAKFFRLSTSTRTRSGPEFENSLVAALHLRSSRHGILRILCDGNTSIHLVKLVTIPLRNIILIGHGIARLKVIHNGAAWTLGH